MGLGVSTRFTVFAIACFVILGLVAFIAGCYLSKKLLRGCHMLWNDSLRAHALLFIGFAIYLYARASKAISSIFSSTSELQNSAIHRRRYLLGGSATLHEYPGVIPSYDSRSERMLSKYGRSLNFYAKIPDTNATVFRVRSWLRNCEQNHNGRNGNPYCQPLNEEGRGYPLWLIDIEQRCVVPFRATLSYFALSYVWGRVETAKLERSNVVQLQQPGSLLGPHQAVTLPKTIKDAMFLTGFLGHRYLWCDRLCLVQDDISSKLPQIQHMAEIYARAHCTVIAFDNLNANSGLHGLPSLTRCSHRQASTSADTKQAGWSSRAWTFQEELFSVRIIQLSSLAVNWQCSPLHGKQSTWGSNHDNSGPIRSLQFESDIDISGLGTPVQVGGMSCPSHTSLAYYINLAERYSQRQVNEHHPEDIFHAFSSVQLILKASYPGAFIQGIPECLFVPCLLWNTSMSSYKDFVDPVTGMRASSWSWIGWSAPIYYPMVIIQYSTSWDWRALVSWYVSLKKDSRRYPVSVAKDEGWARHKRVEGRSSASVLPLNASSTSRVDMSLESQGFGHIVPLSADSPEPSTLEAKNLCSFLHGRVLMARFRVHYKQTRRLRGRVGVLLCETGGNYAGVLCGLTASEEGLEGQLIHMIAISKGSTERWRYCRRHCDRGLEPEDFVDPIAERRCSRERCHSYFPPLTNSMRYEFYDVLWVEYKDGVAYRKDIGRVIRQVWDRETLGWIDITLG